MMKKPGTSKDVDVAPTFIQRARDSGTVFCPLGGGQLPSRSFSAALSNMASARMPFQTRVLVFKAFKSFRLADIHATIFGLPFIHGRVADAVLAA